MKKILFIILFHSCLYLHAQHPSVDARWQLVLDENFDSSAINQDIWRPRTGSDWTTEYNDSTGECSPPLLNAYALGEFPNKNVVLDTVNDYVSIFVRDTSISAEYWCEKTVVTDSGIFTFYPRKYFNVDYTVGMLQSKISYKYGYFECRFLMPYDSTNDSQNYGCFGPNFWMWGESVDYRGEIDVYENNHNNNTIRYSNAVHDWANEKHTENNFIYDIPVNQWHTAACNWTPDRIDFYLDNVITRTIYHDWIDNLGPMELIIGVQAPSFPPDLPNYQLNSPNVQYPYEYKIDYVKIWQLNQDCTTDVSFCSSGPDTTNNSQTYRTITSSGTACDIIFGDNTSLKATEYILLNDNTTIPIPAAGEMHILEVDGCMD